MLDSDWLIAVIFCFTNSGLAMWICRICASYRCICIRFIFSSWYLQNRICRFYPSPRRLRKILVERRTISSQDWYFSQISLTHMIYLFNYTKYYLHRDACNKICENVTIVFSVFTLHRDAYNKICKTLSVVRFM
jgi:hypothetical protein